MKIVLVQGNRTVCSLSWLFYDAWKNDLSWEAQKKLWMWLIAAHMGFNLPKRSYFNFRFVKGPVSCPKAKDLIERFRELESKFLSFVKERRGKEKDVTVYLCGGGPGGNAGFPDFVVVHCTGNVERDLSILLHELIHYFFEEGNEERVLELTREFLSC